MTPKPSFSVVTALSAIFSVVTAEVVIEVAIVWTPSLEELVPVTGPVNVIVLLLLNLDAVAAFPDRLPMNVEAVIVYFAALTFPDNEVAPVTVRVLIVVFANEVAPVTVRVLIVVFAKYL